MMNVTRDAAAALLLAFVGLMPVLASPQEWPALPDRDADVLIPAQECPRYPGPRTVKVYIRYPGGERANVTEETGLFLSCHNWAGTAWSGTANPADLAAQYDVVGISVDYLGSGKDWKETPPYDFGYFQSLDALRALWFVFNGLAEDGVAFNRGRICVTGGSGGGNVTLMSNKLAPRTFSCAVDMCGMAKLSDDLAFGLPGGSRLDAMFSTDPEHPRYLARDAQELRFVGNPAHLKTMLGLGNRVKMVVIHGADDDVCPVADAREMAANMQAAGMDVKTVWVTKDMLDGKVFKSTGHSMGDRTRIIEQVAGAYILPDSPGAVIRQGKTDFELRDRKVRYETRNGAYVISYENGYPVGTFERD